MYRSSYVPLGEQKKFCVLGTGNEENQPLFLGEFGDRGAVRNGRIEKGNGARDE